MQGVLDDPTTISELERLVYTVTLYDASGLVKRHTLSHFYWYHDRPRPYLAWETFFSVKQVC